ncbi:DUF2332 domain-containing protein [soil metagenome]
MSHPLSEMFRQQARTILTVSPLSATLLTAAADDLDQDGPTAAVMAASAHDPHFSVPPLRWLGALHRLVREGRAPELAAHYPSVGGTDPVRTAWPAARAVLHEHRHTLADYVLLPVQTNEVGRCAVLLGGLLVVGQRVRLPIRLLEIGASAGLAMNFDRYAYLIDARVLGDSDSGCRLDRPWRGYPPADPSFPLHITDRRGCDPRPVDGTTAEGRLTMMSYVWADWIERLDRLRAALAIVAEHPVEVERSRAGSWLAQQLSWPRPGVVTVLWHSMVWQYIDRVEQTEIEDLIAAAGARATATAPLAVLGFENVAPPRRPGRFELSLTTWPGGQQEKLATAAAHGIPTTWATPWPRRSARTAWTGGSIGRSTMCS